MQERNLRQIDIIKLAEPLCKEYNLKLSKSDLSQFVSGKVEPGQWKLTILGKALGVSEAWLMGYDVPMERKAEPGKAAGDSSLTQPEAELVSCYRSLNRKGKDILLSTAKAFAGNPDMTAEEKEVSKAM
jgi:hypothetical protein